MVLRDLSYADALAGQSRAKPCASRGLLIAVSFTTACWVLALMLGCHVLGIQTSASFLVGFGLVIAALSCVSVAIVTA
jgi:hypothetical protein